MLPLHTSMVRCGCWRLELLLDAMERDNLGSAILLSPLAPSSSSHPVHVFFCIFILWSPHPLLTPLSCCCPCFLAPSSPLQPDFHPAFILSLLSPLPWSSSPILIPDILCHLLPSPQPYLPTGAGHE